MGAGPAGCVAARHLAQQGRLVVLIERQASPSKRIGETLPPAGESLLRQMNLFEPFEAQCHIRSTTICSAWISEELRSTDYSLHPFGFWWHVDRKDFDTMLLKETEQSGVNITRAAKVVDLSRFDDKNLWRVKFQSGSHIGAVESRFLIDATGRASFVAQRLGVKRRRIDRMVAIAGFFDLRFGATRGSTDSAVIEPTDGGWWYMEPMLGTRRIATFFTDADLLKGKSILRSWVSQYQRTEHVRKELSGWEFQQSLKVYVADSSVLSTCSGEAWLAVGDAAAARDPLSSSGLLYALESGRLSSKVTNEFLDGNSESVAEYDQTVKRSFVEYVTNRDRYYSLVARWPDSCFWQRRMRRPEKTNY